LTFSILKTDLLPALPPHSSIDPSTIVDDVFCTIEKDPNLLDLYKNSWGASKCNGIISKFLKSHYGLVNATKAGTPQKNNAPRSGLIQSHQIFK